MSCPACFSGHVNPGTPRGRIETVHGLQTYISEPKDGKLPAKGIVVIVPDAFGLPFANNQVLADHYADMGPFLVYLPDFMDGKPSKVSTMTSMAHLFDKDEAWLSWCSHLLGVLVDFIPFMIRNRFSVSWPKVTSFLTALRASDQGKNLPVGVAGFCWGGLHAIHLAHGTPSGEPPLVDAVFAAHPSNLTLPADIEAVLKGGVGVSIAVGDDDAVMKAADVYKAKEILEKKGGAGGDSEVVVYEGAKHGFAVRASRWKPDSQETRQAEEAERQAVAWFQRRFAAVKDRYPAAGK